jgi:hypothetical protein
MVHRVIRRRNQVYEDKDFQIQSLTSLVRTAKRKACEKLNNDNADSKSIQLPLHEFTDRLSESLQQMNHHLQSLLIQKLGPEARNIIAAERARQYRLEKERREKAMKKDSKKPDEEKKDVDRIASHLSDVVQDNKDELELLNDYRERYASILAELLVAKDRLKKLEKNLKEQDVDPNLERRLTRDLEELSDDETERKRRTRERKKRRRSSTGSSSVTSDDSQTPMSPKIGFKIWSRDGNEK